MYYRFRSKSCFIFLFQGLVISRLQFFSFISVYIAYGTIRWYFIYIISVYLHIFVCFTVIHSFKQPLFVQIYRQRLGFIFFRVLFFLTQDDAKIDQLQTLANYDPMIMITITWPVNREAWICVPSHLVSEKKSFSSC